MALAKTGHRSETVFFKTIYPAKPAITEANKILILALSINSVSLNARLEINRAIVNPIPPSRPTPSICIHLTFSGSEAIPILYAIHEKRSMPTDLPKINPNTIPMLAGVVAADSMLSPNKTPVLLNEKTGMMKNMTQGRNSFSSDCNGGS